MASSDVMCILQRELQLTRERESDIQQVLRNVQANIENDKELLNLYQMAIVKLREALMQERQLQDESPKHFQKSLRQKNHENEESPGSLWHRFSREEIRDRNDTDSSDTSHWGCASPYKEESVTLSDEARDYKVQNEAIRSKTHALDSSIMQQYLPSSLLDSPHIDKNDASLFISEHSDTPESDSTSTRSTVNGAVAYDEDYYRRFTGNIRGKHPSGKTGKGRQSDQQAYHRLEFGQLNYSHTDGLAVMASDEREHAYCIENESASSSTAIKPCGTVILSALSPLSTVFQFIAKEELEHILIAVEGDVSAAIDRILYEHPSMYPSDVMVDLKSRESSDDNIYWSARNDWNTGTCPLEYGPLQNYAQKNSFVLSNRRKYDSNVENGSFLIKRQNAKVSQKNFRNDDYRSSLASSVSDGFSPRMHSYKTEICLFYLRGTCNYAKEECRFAHGEKDLREIHDNKARQMCLSTKSRAINLGLRDFASVSANGLFTLPSAYVCSQSTHHSADNTKQYQQRDQENLPSLVQCGIDRFDASCTETLPDMERRSTHASCYHIDSHHCFRQRNHSSHFVHQMHPRQKVSSLHAVRNTRGRKMASEW